MLDGSMTELIMDDVIVGIDGSKGSAGPLGWAANEGLTLTEPMKPSKAPQARRPTTTVAAAWGWIGQ